SAVWYDVGRLAGLTGAGGVYWVRFLNVFVYAGLIAASYGFCLRYFGREVARGVSLLVTFFPNTVFYTVNSDVLSPLLVLLALDFLLRWHAAAQPSPSLSAAAGLLAAAAVLTKLTNVAILLACAVVLFLRGCRAFRAGR